MRWVLGAAFVLVACGGRTEIAGAPSEDGGPPRSVVTCHPGDPPLVLVGTTDYGGGIATDGSFVYVAYQGSVWRVSASGGERVTLRAETSSWISRLAAGDDGVYMEIHTANSTSPTGEETEGLWARHDGAAQRSVQFGAFAPPLVYWSEWNPTTMSGRIRVTSLVENDTAHDLANVGALHLLGAVTNRFVYGVEVLYACERVVRIDRTTGSIEPIAGNACELLPGFAASGPNAACSSMGCILDEEAEPMVLRGTLALDGDYAYARQPQNGLHRVALRAAADDLVTPLEAIDAAVANGCVYVQTRTAIVRVAAP